MNHHGEAGGESSAVKRLTMDLGDPVQREILARCLTGTVAPVLALDQLLVETGDASAVRAMIDEITMRAASISRATDSLLRDRVDELTQLIVDDDWHRDSLEPEGPASN
ncbi:MAG: hypothetical protein ACR2GK_03285 [Gemmatimonadaceae bacterium]